MRLLLAALLAVSAYAQTNLKFEDYALPNGLRVILHVERRAPVVHVNLRFYVGSKDERPGRTGFAHLFEHMMFQGTDAKSGFEWETAQLGATGFNGETGYDATHFYETVPSSRLERMLWLKAKQFTEFLDVLNQERLDNQRGVVRNELRQRIENQPYGDFGVLMFENAFPGDHPYAHAVLGTHDDLVAATLEDVRAFYREYYTPDRASLLLTGDFDAAQAKAWVAKYFGGWAPAGGQTGRPHSAPQMSAPKLVEVRAHVPDERIYFVWPTPGLFEAEQSAIDVAGYIFSDAGEYLATQLKEKLCTDVEEHSSEQMDASLWILQVTPAPGATVEEIGAVIQAQMAKFAREGPAEEKITRARNSLEFRMVKDLEDPYNVALRAQMLEQRYGSTARFGEWAEGYRKVTAADVKAAVGKWLSTPNRLAIHYIPETARKADTPLAGALPAPPFQPEKPYLPPGMKSAKLPNGFEVLVMERRELPITAVELRFKIGPAFDLPGRNGAAMLAISTLDSGTTNRTHSQIQDEKTRLAIDVHGDADGNSQTAGFEALRRSLEPGVALLADLVRNANWPKEEFEEERKEPLAQLEKTEGRIDDFVLPAIKIAYGIEHPLWSWIGTPESRRAITSQDLIEFKNRYWKPDIAALAFAGDISLEEAVAMATKYFGDWSGKAGEPRAMPAAQPMAGRLFLMDKPGATQTMVVQALPGIPRTSPDFPAMLLLDSVWGGGYFSRLNMDIREEKGIAYGAGMLMYHFPGSGMLIGNSPVEAGRTHDAIAAFMRELAALGTEKPVTQKELDLAKELFARGFPRGYAEAWPAVEAMARDWAYGLPLDDYRTLQERVAAVTLEQVNAAARKYARPERAFYLLLGDRAKIGTGFGDLGLGELKVLK